MTTRTIIHLSDLHIGRRKKEDHRVRRIFGKIKDTFPRVPVLITGDLTDSATKGQFQKTRAILNELAETNPILAVPGNHDYAWKGVILREGSWEEWVKYLGTPLGWHKPETNWMLPSNEPIGVDGVGVWRDDPVVFFGVDSGDPADHEKTARGWISPELAKGLAASLKQYQGKTRVVLVHHHPFMHRRTMEMEGAKRFIKAVSKNCELLLFGHKHNYGIWRLREQVPLTISSHRSTNQLIDREYLAITVIQIENAGEPNASFNHRLDMVA